MGKIMKKSLALSKIIFVSLFLAVAWLAAIYVGIPILMDPISGRPYFDNHRDRSKLHEIAKEYDPIIAALAQYREDEGRFPTGLGELIKSVDGLQDHISADRIHGRTIYYHPEGREYVFYVKLNWDGGLVYSSEDGHWIYDPGNGDPDWPIIPTTTN
jgi:hypothetical protein